MTPKRQLTRARLAIVQLRDQLGELETSSLTAEELLNLADELEAVAADLTNALHVTEPCSPECPH